VECRLQRAGALGGVCRLPGQHRRHLIRIVNQNFLYPNNPAFGPVYFPQPDTNSNYSADVEPERGVARVAELATKLKFLNIP
jgi:hypothetical protein